MSGDWANNCDPHPYADDGFGDEDWDFEKACINCGGQSVGDVCAQCGMPLCPMCGECGAGFCHDHPNEHFQGF